MPNLNDIWEEHIRDEFVTRDTEATLGTMVADDPSLPSNELMRRVGR
jgi:hypothetical protein